jgi:hypothetical protein
MQKYSLDDPVLDGKKTRVEVDYVVVEEENNISY